MAVGDLAYFNGTTAEFTNCYGPRWGRHKIRTSPAVGNHEYGSPGAGPYWIYFGDAAGPAGLGYYSYQLGNWHIVVLNSSVDASTGSPQIAWLRDDLFAHRTTPCTLAYWHHPRFTSGPSGGGFMGDAWRTLHEFGADVVVSGHDHGYERFAPQDPDGRSDPARGLTEFVVGTGGAPLYQFGAIRPNSVVRMSAYGVIQFTLTAGAYSWQFVQAVNSTVRDPGAALCH